MNETKTAYLAQQHRSDLQRASLEDPTNATKPMAQLQIIEATSSTETSDGQEAYERGTALKNVGLFRQAAEHFEKAAQDPAYALKGFAQMGLSLKKSGKQEEAVVAFRRALQVPATLVEGTSADPLPLRENVGVTRAYSRGVGVLSMAPP